MPQKFRRWKQQNSYSIRVMTSPKPPIITSPELASTRSPRSPVPAPRNSFARLCLPEVHLLSASGALELLCEVPCGPGMAVRWTQAPGGLEAYETREVGAQAWLSSRSMLWSGCHPEGWFQCRLDPGGHTANLYVVPEICEFWGCRGLGGRGTLCPGLRQGVPC